MPGSPGIPLGPCKTSKTWHLYILQLSDVRLSVSPSDFMDVLDDRRSQDIFGTLVPRRLRLAGIADPRNRPVAPMMLCPFV